MNKETNARGQRLVGASRHVGSLVALVAGGLLHHKDFRHAQVHPKDRATVYITIGYNKQFYVSYGIVRERGVNRRREVDFVVPPLCATLRSFFTMRQFLLCFSALRNTVTCFPTVLSVSADTANTIFFYRVKNDGLTDVAERNFQVVGLEGEPKIDEFIRGIAPALQGIATALREKAEGTGEGTHQANDQDVTCPTRISDLAELCCKAHLRSKENSGYKDLITGFVRVGLGEMLAAVMRHVDAAYIGISKGMFDVGTNILRARDKLVHQSKSAQGKPRGGKANKRPDIKCTVRSTLMNMCKAAAGWEERASFTGFICALLYSITQGEDTDMLDTLRISQVTGKAWTKQGKKEGKEKDLNEIEQENEPLYPGSRNILHQVSDTHLRLVFQCIFRIFTAGGFWLMPHAHAPFDQEMLRGSVDNEMPTCVLMKQVQEFVCKQLGSSVSGGEELAYSNWWTLANNKGKVTTIFSQTKEEMEKMGWVWITVNPMRSAVSMAFTLGNVLHNIDPAVCKDKQKSKKNEKKCKKKKGTPDNEEEDEEFEQEEEEAEEGSGSDEDEEEDEVSKKLKDKKRKRKKKEEKLMTVEEHEKALSITLDVFGVLLAMKVPADNVSAEEYLLSEKPIKRKRTRKPRGKPNAAGSGELLEEILEEVVDHSPANVEVPEPAVHSTHDTVRMSEQLPVHSIGPLLSHDQCNLFRAGIFSEQVELCEFVVAVEHLYFNQADFGRAKQFPSGQLFAVFSHQDSPAGKKPLIVFPALPEEKEGKVQFRVDIETPVSFDQHKQACFFWTFLVPSEVRRSIKFNSQTKRFWFEDRILEDAVAQILGSKKTLTMFKDAELLKHVFGNESKDPPCSLWLIDTLSGDGTKGVGFEEQADSVRRVIEHALAANTEPVRKGTVRYSPEIWQKALVDRTTYKDLKTLVKKGRGAKNESPLALYVDLLNVDVLEKIIGVDCEKHWDTYGCESICVVEAIIDHSSKTFSNVALYSPSWWCDRRCNERTKFIVLVGEKDSLRRSLLTLVRNPRSTEDVKACTTVIKGCDLQKYAPKLMQKVLAISDPHVFQPRIAPTAFLSGMQGVDNVGNWTASQRLTSPEVTGDGACWIWAFLVLLGILPCLPKEHPTPAHLHAWALFWFPVANRFRQMVAAVLFAVCDAYKDVHGLNFESVLFGENSTLRYRWEKYFGEKPAVNILNPTAWGSDLELLVGSWLLNINLNTFDKRVDNLLSFKTVTRAFHHDCLKKSRVTLTGKFPTQCFSSMKDKLPEFHGFVKVDATQHSGDACAPCFVEALGFCNYDDDVLDSTLAQGIARGVLDAEYQTSQSPRCSLFMTFDINHFTPILPCVEKVVCARHSAGGDVISGRLNGFGRNTDVTKNLLDLAVDVMLKAKSGDIVNGTYVNARGAVTAFAVHVEDILGCQLEDPYLSAVHSCANNATVTSVATLYNPWNRGLEAVQLYKGNRDVVDPKHGVQRSCLVITNSKLCTKVTQEALKLKEKLRKDTRLLVPLCAEDVRRKAQAQGQKTEQDCDVLRSMITVRCYESVKKAYKNFHAGSRVFGVFSALSHSPSGIVSSPLPQALDMTLSEPENGTCSAFFAFFKQYCTLKTLVAFLCTGIRDRESRTYLWLCARFRETCKGALAMCPLGNDLWRAALYSQSPEFEKSHGYLGPTIQAIVVPESTMETVGTKEGTTEVRERHRVCQQLLIFISVGGGWGVYAVRDLTDKVYLTEYGGRYLDEKQVKDLTLANKASHVLTVANKALHVDGNPEQEGWSRIYLAERHQASAWNRVSF